MNDFLLSGAFMLFIFGMSLLVAVYYLTDPSEYTIEEIRGTDIEHFRTSGYVRDVQDRGNVIFITIEEQCALSGMVFSDGKTDFSLFENTFVVVRGHTSTYRDEITYIFDDIRRG